MITQERNINRSMNSAVAITRNFAKARMGDESAVMWLVKESRAGNVAATKAINDLAKMMPPAGQSLAA
jgi:hypothetical protein